MALRQKHDALETAERLLRQNKVHEALGLLERVTEVRSADLLTLNRICDQLVRHKRIEEAIRHYHKIAAEFSRAGFYPKAAAIHKKILRLHPGHVDSLVRLGELYIEQRLPGEACTYLLHAAERCLKAGDFARAREVYEILVEAEPGDPRHRARLAETRAAEGDTEQAGNELLLLADSLFSAGKPGDAEQTYRRASELLPGAVEPLLGICKSMSEQGRQAEALALLEKKAGEKNAPASIGSELALYLTLCGRDDESLKRLESLDPGELRAETLMRLFRFHLDGGRIDSFWDSMDPVFAVWAGKSSAGRIEALYARLGTLEQKGHVPALKRLYELAEKAGDKKGMVGAAEDLVRAYRARNMVDEAGAMLQRLREVAPHSPLVAGPARGPTAAAAEGAPAAAPQAPPAEPAPPAGQSAAPVEAEAPAVPLNRSDEEFVAGRMTQAEILEKYGLFDQATDQVREVTARFPGHVGAAERLVALLRTGTRRDQHQDALVKLALARRAIGDAKGAAAAVAEAGRIGELEAEARRLLERVGLIQGAAAEPAPDEPPLAVAETPAAAAEAPGERAPDEPPEELVEEADEAVPADEAPPGAQVAAETRESHEADAAAAEGARAIVIDFDEVEDGEEELPPPRPEPRARPAPRVRAPGADMLDEIRLQLTSGKPGEAHRRMRTLRLLGYASDAMDRLDEEIGDALAAGPATPAAAASPQAAPAPEPLQESVAAAPAAEPAEPAGAEWPPPVEEPEEAAAPLAAGPADDDDLSTITAALESELFADEDDAVVPEAQSEQSLEDVFSAFKRHVAEEVGSDDFRTHYDLGIAYKEMGLIGEAIGEFEVAVQSAEMSRESSIMLAICHRDRREADRAIEWYRRAIDAPGGDPESVAGLRYDLAEALLERGDVEQALQAFRDVLAADPGFRDVRERVEQLESRLTT